MKHPTPSAWLHRLLAENGPEQNGREMSARARRAREDAHRWLQALQEEHERQLVERHKHGASEPSARGGRRH